MEFQTAGTVAGATGDGSWKNWLKQTAASGAAAYVGNLAFESVSGTMGGTSIGQGSSGVLLTDLSASVAEATAAHVTRIPCISNDMNVVLGQSPFSGLDKAALGGLLHEAVRPALPEGLMGRLAGQTIVGLAQGNTIEDSLRQAALSMGLAHAFTAAPQLFEQLVHAQAESARLAGQKQEVQTAFGRFSGSGPYEGTFTNPFGTLHQEAFAFEVASSDGYSQPMHFSLSGKHLTSARPVLSAESSLPLDSWVSPLGAGAFAAGKAMDVFGIAKHASDAKWSIAARYKNLKVPNVAGFFFEVHHASTFNIKASLLGKDLRAFTTASLGDPRNPVVDIVIKDGKGVPRSSAQLKSGKTASGQIRKAKYANVPQKIVPTSMAGKGIATTLSHGGVASVEISNSKLQADVKNNMQAKQPLFKGAGETLQKVGKAAKLAGKVFFWAGAAWSVTENVYDVIHGDKTVGQASLAVLADVSGYTLVKDVSSFPEAEFSLK
eukprot:3932078-Amphidinium_carterae.1